MTLVGNPFVKAVEYQLKNGSDSSDNYLPCVAIAGALVCGVVFWKRTSRDSITALHSRQQEKPSRRRSVMKKQRRKSHDSVVICDQTAHQFDSVAASSHKQRRKTHDSVVRNHQAAHQIDSVSASCSHVRGDVVPTGNETVSADKRKKKKKNPRRSSLDSPQCDAGIDRERLINDKQAVSLTVWSTEDSAVVKPISEDGEATTVSSTPPASSIYPVTDHHEEQKDATEQHGDLDKSLTLPCNKLVSCLSEPKKPCLSQIEEPCPSEPEKSCILDPTSELCPSAPQQRCLSRPSGERCPSRPSGKRCSSEFTSLTKPVGERCPSESADQGCLFEPHDPLSPPEERCLSANEKRYLSETVERCRNETEERCDSETEERCPSESADQGCLFELQDSPSPPEERCLSANEERYPSETVQRCRNETEERCDSETEERCHSETEERCHSETEERCFSETVERCHSETQERCRSETEERCRSEDEDRCRSEAEEQCHSETVERCFSEAEERCHSETQERCHSETEERCRSEDEERCRSEDEERCRSEAEERCLSQTGGRRQNLTESSSSGQVDSPEFELSQPSTLRWAGMCDVASDLPPATDLVFGCSLRSETQCSNGLPSRDLRSVRRVDATILLRNQSNANPSNYSDSDYSDSMSVSDSPLGRITDLETSASNGYGSASGASACSSEGPKSESEAPHNFYEAGETVGQDQSRTSESQRFADPPEPEQRTQPDPVPDEFGLDFNTQEFCRSIATCDESTCLAPHPPGGEVQKAWCLVMHSLTGKINLEWDSFISSVHTINRWSQNESDVRKLGIWPSVKKSLHALANVGYDDFDFLKDDSTCPDSLEACRRMICSSPLLPLVDQIAPPRKDCATNTLTHLRTLIQQQFPGSKAVTVGSYSWGINTGRSDIDIVILTSHSPRQVLHCLANLFRSNNVTLPLRNASVQLIDSVRLPVLTIKLDLGAGGEELTLDMTVNQYHSVRDTLFFRWILHGNTSLQVYMRCIKFFIQVRGLPSCVEGGFPSIVWSRLALKAYRSFNKEFLTSQHEQVLVPNQDIDNVMAALRFFFIQYGQGFEVFPTDGNVDPIRLAEDDASKISSLHVSPATALIYKVELNRAAHFLAMACNAKDAPARNGVVDQVFMDNAKISLLKSECFFGLFLDTTNQRMSIACVGAFQGGDKRRVGNDEFYSRHDGTLMKCNLYVLDQKCLPPKQQGRYLTGVGRADFMPNQFITRIHVWQQPSKRSSTLRFSINANTYARIQQVGTVLQNQGGAAVHHRWR